MRRTANPASAEQGKIQLSDGNLGKSLIEKAKSYCVIIIIITRIKSLDTFGLKDLLKEK